MKLVNRTQRFQRVSPARPPFPVGSLVRQTFLKEAPYAQQPLRVVGYATSPKGTVHVLVREDWPLFVPTDVYDRMKNISYIATEEEGRLLIFRQDLLQPLPI